MELIFVMGLEFIEHPSFQKELASLERRFGNVDKGLESVKLIFQVHFHPITPRLVIAPAKIHRVTQNDSWAMWKIEMAVKGLRPNQFPRIWFAIKGATVVFVCACVHMDNYNDTAMNRLALGRITDIL